MSTEENGCWCPGSFTTLHCQVTNKRVPCLSSSCHHILVIWYYGFTIMVLNTLRPRQDGRLFPDDIFKYIFFNENVWILIKISLRFVPKAPINNIPALVQIMAWRRPGDKPLSEPMMVNLPTHICVTQPQWVNWVNILAADAPAPCITRSSAVRMLSM